MIFVFMICVYTIYNRAKCFVFQIYWWFLVANWNSLEYLPSTYVIKRFIYKAYSKGRSFLYDPSRLDRGLIILSKLSK